MMYSFIGLKEVMESQQCSSHTLTRLCAFPLLFVINALSKSEHFKKLFLQEQYYTVLHTRAGGRAVDLGGPSVNQGGQSLKLITETVVFKQVSLLIGGPSMSVWGLDPPAPHWCRPCCTPKDQLILITKVSCNLD